MVLLKISLVSSWCLQCQDDIAVGLLDEGRKRCGSMVVRFAVTGCFPSPSNVSVSPALSQDATNDDPVACTYSRA